MNKYNLKNIKQFPKYHIWEGLQYKSYDNIRLNLFSNVQLIGGDLLLIDNTLFEIIDFKFEDYSEQQYTKYFIDEQGNTDLNASRVLEEYHEKIGNSFGIANVNSHTRFYKLEIKKVL